MVAKKPEVSTGLAQSEMEKCEKQFDAFDEQVKSMTMDRMNLAPKEEIDPQTKLSSKEAQKSNDIYLKPTKRVGAPEKFNEKFRQAYEYDKELVKFIAENREIIGESIEIWTKPYAGMHAEYWQVPVNKPVWGPRYLAEQIKRKYYHRLTMDEKPLDSNYVGSSGMGAMYGKMAVDTTVQRLDAYPVSEKKTLFMGSRNF